MGKQEEDIIVYGASCGVLLLATILSYITYRILQPPQPQKPIDKAEVDNDEDSSRRNIHRSHEWARGLGRHRKAAFEFLKRGSTRRKPGAKVHAVSPELEQVKREVSGGSVGDEVRHKSGEVLNIVD